MNWYHQTLLIFIGKGDQDDEITRELCFPAVHNGDSRYGQLLGVVEDLFPYHDNEQLNGKLKETTVCSTLVNPQAKNAVVSSRIAT